MTSRKHRGFSSDDLLKALKSDLSANKAAGAPELSDDQLTGIATNIAAGKGPGGPGGSPPPRRIGSDDSTIDTNLATLAEGLGISSDELLQKLQAGLKTSPLCGGFERSRRPDSNRGPLHYE